MRNLVLLVLGIHLVAQAAMQTSYAGYVSAIRWPSLMALVVLGVLAWTDGPKADRAQQATLTRVILYFILWGFTVLAAESPMFSGYRLVAHAAIVFSALIVLPSIIRPANIRKIVAYFKVLVVTVLVASYFAPAPVTIFDDERFFRGIFGNSNAFGHMAAVGCLIFAAGALYSKGQLKRVSHMALSGVSGLLVLQSGARSSAIALAFGLLAIAVLRGSASQYLVLAVLLFVAILILKPDVVDTIGAFLAKNGWSTDRQLSIEKITSSRREIWEGHLDGFLDRPFLGWGFGRDKLMDLSGWSGEWTSLLVGGRDPINDTLYTLETGGVIGLFAYIMLLAVIRYAWIGRVALQRLSHGVSPTSTSYVSTISEAYIVFFALTVALIALFQFDNTALAAGNFFSVLIWVSLGISLGIKRVVMSLLQNRGLDRRNS